MIKRFYSIHGADHGPACGLVGGYCSDCFTRRDLHFIIKYMSFFMSKPL